MRINTFPSQWTQWTRCTGGQAARTTNNPAVAHEGIPVGAVLVVAGPWACGEGWEIGSLGGLEGKAGAVFRGLGVVREYLQVVGTRRLVEEERRSEPWLLGCTVRWSWSNDAIHTHRPMTAHPLQSLSPQIVPAQWVPASRSHPLSSLDTVTWLLCPSGTEHRRKGGQQGPRHYSWTSGGNLLGSNPFYPGLPAEAVENSRGQLLEGQALWPEPHLSAEVALVWPTLPPATKKPLLSSQTCPGKTAGSSCHPLVMLRKAGVEESHAAMAPDRDRSSCRTPICLSTCV